MQTIQLYQALKNLQVPEPDGEYPEFSLDFVAKQGEREGQILHIEKAVFNHHSKQKAKAKLKGIEPTTKKGQYSRKDTDTITLRVLESKDITHDVISVKVLLITKINDLRTAI